MFKSSCQIVEDYKFHVMFGFCDLCVNVDFNGDSKNKLRRILARLYDMGYSTVAINRVVEESVFDSERKGKKKSGENDSTNPPIPGPENLDDIKSEFAGRLRILSRITFIYSDLTKTHTLNQSLNLRRYDLYAVVPRTQAAFQFACSQLNVDVIFIDNSCTGIKLTRKLYLQAVDRGIHFEIQYASVIDNDTRKFAIHYSHLYYMFGKSKNVVISSGATEAIQIRNPYDVINLGAILGLNETKSKASILSQSRQLILKAEGRRYGKAIFQIQTKERDEKEEVEEEEEEEEEEDESEEKSVIQDNDDCPDRKKIKL